MGELLSTGLLLPALVLGILGFAVPRVLATVLPEGVTALLVNGFASTVVVFALASLFFCLLYAWQGVSLAAFGQSETASAVLYFGRLGLLSGLIWAPVMLLSLSGLPGRWVHETW